MDIPEGIQDKLVEEIVKGLKPRLEAAVDPLMDEIENLSQRLADALANK